MKIRFSYVSNSSSSSFIVNKDTTDLGIPCIKLTGELVNLLNKYGHYSYLNKISLSTEQEWYLTSFVGDINDDYYELNKIGIPYMNGNLHGNTHDDADEYIVFNIGNDSFYLHSFDIINKADEIPNVFNLADSIKEVLDNNLDNNDKIKCIAEIMNFYSKEGGNEDSF